MYFGINIYIMVFIKINFTIIFFQLNISVLIFGHLHVWLKKDNCKIYLINTIIFLCQNISKGCSHCLQITKCLQYNIKICDVI